jgi:hypothetical protein
MLVIVATAGQNVKHHEIEMVRQLQLVEVVAREKGAQARGQTSPTTQRCIARDFAAATSGQRCRASATSGGPSLQTAQSAQGDGVRIFHVHRLAWTGSSIHAAARGVDYPVAAKIRGGPLAPLTGQCPRRQSFLSIKAQLLSDLFGPKAFFATFHKPDHVLQRVGYFVG